MKTLTGVILTTLILCNINNVFAGDYKYVQNSYGSGYNKGDALASALLRLPYGARIQKINFNGSSTHRCVSGIGYIQTRGSYRATVIYSK
jgi:hypothetical protein